MLRNNQMLNPLLMMQKFNEFKNNFSGDPKAEVMKLVQSGRMSQEQLNQFQNMATQFQNMMMNFKR